MNKSIYLRKEIICMAKQVVINTRIEGGKFKRNNRLIKHAIQEFEGKEIEIIFKRKYKQRSVPQNNTYWGLYIPFFQEMILDAWGEIKSAEDIHELLKYTCNYEEKINPATGEIINVAKSTTELTTSGWMDYELQLKQFAMDYFNAVLPEPNSQTELNF